MRISILCLALAFPIPALADDCAARLSALLAAEPYAGQPYIAETTMVVGGVPGRVTQNWANPRHSLMVTHEPPGMPDTLQYEGVTYMPDGSGGWTKLYETDPVAMEQASADMRAAMAGAIATATCGSEDRDGKTMDRLDGTLSNLPPYEGDVTVRYMVDPASGNVAELQMAYRMTGIESTVTFVFTPAPDMVLPVP